MGTDGRQFVARDEPLPDPAGSCLEKYFRGSLPHEPSAHHDGQIGGHRFHIGNNVRGQDHDPLAGKVRKQVAEPDALFGSSPAVGSSTIRAGDR